MNISSDFNEAGFLSTVDGPVPLKFQIIYFVFVGFIFMFGLPGNLVIIMVYARNKAKTSCDWLILFIGVTDFLVCLVSPLLCLHTELDFEVPYINGVLCGFEIVWQLTGMTTSCFIFSILSMERYIRISRTGAKTLTPKMTKILSALCLIIALCISVYHAHPQFQKDSCSHMANAGVNTKLVLFAIFLLCFVIVVFTYGSVIHTLEKHIKVKLRLIENKGLSKDGHSPMIESKRHREEDKLLNESGGNTEESDNLMSELDVPVEIEKKVKYSELYEETDNFNNCDREQVIGNLNKNHSQRELQCTANGSGNDNRDGISIIELKETDENNIHADDSMSEMLRKDGVNLDNNVLNSPQVSIPGGNDDLNLSPNTSPTNVLISESKLTSSNSLIENVHTTSDPDFVKCSNDELHTIPLFQSLKHKMDDDDFDTSVSEQINVNHDSLKELTQNPDTRIKTETNAGNAEECITNCKSQNSSASGNYCTKDQNQPTTRHPLNSVENKKSHVAFLQNTDVAFVQKTDVAFAQNTDVAFVQKPDLAMDKSLLEEAPPKKRLSNMHRKRWIRERQVTLMLLCVTVVFLGTWLPAWILYLLATQGNNIMPPGVITRVLYRYCYKIYLLNYVANFHIYYRFNATFRTKAKAVLPRRFRKYCMCCCLRNLDNDK